MSLLSLPDPGAKKQHEIKTMKIEETFHTFKQAMREKKAWAKSPVARQMQANFICLCHNLSIYAKI
jgi:hypothetical protein